MIHQQATHLNEELKEYLDEEAEKHLTLIFWHPYMELAGILLRFTRAAREGNWNLYISSFAEMLP